MKKVMILNFQYIQKSNINMFENPFEQGNFSSDNILSVVFVREPFSYLDVMLYHYLKEEKSLLFTGDIIKQMKKLEGSAFVEWLDTLSFIPFYNPQTFYLDMRKRLTKAKKNLEKFDYVVPWEARFEFQKNIMPNIEFNESEEKCVNFSFAEQKDHKLMKKFLQKDQELYAHAITLWKHIQENDFRTLSEFMEKKKDEKCENELKELVVDGIVDLLDERTVAGWVARKDTAESQTVEIYKNGVVLCQAAANRMREGVKKSGRHPTGKCGFRMVFDKETFSKSDTVEVRVIPDGYALPLGRGCKVFLEKT